MNDLGSWLVDSPSDLVRLTSACAAYTKFLTLSDFVGPPFRIFVYSHCARQTSSMVPDDVCILLLQVIITAETTMDAVPTSAFRRRHLPGIHVRVRTTPEYMHIG